MNKPSVIEGTGFINYAWPEYALRVVAERYSDDGFAELSFYSANKGSDSLLHQTRVNLLATTTMNQLVKRMEKNSDKTPWTDILTYITGKTLEIARRGEVTLDIWPSDKAGLAPSYLLEPVLYKNHPSVVFGDYGSAKSLMALVMAYIVQLPYQDNKLGLIPEGDSNKVLYLDYEDDADSFTRRWSSISRGFGHEAAMPVKYRRMTATLYDSVEPLRAEIIDKSIGLIIVDSLGPAARGNLNDPEPAIKYHAALRQLNVTSLTLAHTSKDQLTRSRTIFGSVFFTNLARSVWECKAEQEVGEDDVVISLKQTKANLSKLHLPMGYRIIFGDKITVNKTDLKDTALSGDLPLSWRIRNILNRGPATIAKLTEDMGDSSLDTVGRTLRRMRSKNQVIKLENDLWGNAQ